MAKYKRQDDGCCAVPFLKSLLFIFNIVFLLAGIAVLAVGVWTIVVKQHYMNLLVTGTYAATAHILIVAGVLVFFITVVGCVSIIKEHRCLLLIYTFSLLVIFLLEAVAGILAYVYQEQVQVELTTSLNSTFISSYKFDNDKTKSIDDLHRRLKCCGATNPQEWEYSKWRRVNPDIPNLVPDSCCRTESKQCGKSNHPSNIYVDGCISKLESELSEHLVILGAVGLGLSIVQIFGMVVSCCLYNNVRDKDSRRYY